MTTATTFGLIKHTMPNYNTLIEKYNKSVPRYTSYPTVPFWKDWENNLQWKGTFSDTINIDEDYEKGLSIYIHLPFCESLCTYCACNKRITTNHSVEDKYIDAVLQEWGMYKKLMQRSPIIQSIHLGGGTPTFFSPENLTKLINGILEGASIAPNHAFSIEGHPNNTTEEHLKTLYDLGFRRISFGVQDTDPVVQKAINRIQPTENVRRATEAARRIGFESVNFDLIYGLPFQTIEGMQNTIREAIEIQPDRVAFYSYAHVPWKQKVQRLFDENDLPSAELKTKLYAIGKKMFADAGYTDIGMDHFSLPTDELYYARMNGSLHRNFMGYTDTNCAALIGLGVSAISDIGVAYAQNHKELENYYRSIEADELPTVKGCFLDEADLIFKKYILQTICQGRTTFKEEYKYLLSDYSLPLLQDMEADNLLHFTDDGIEVTKLGFHFVRNICKAFDIKWLTDETNHVGFSKAV